MWARERATGFPVLGNDARHTGRSTSDRFLSLVISQLADRGDLICIALWLFYVALICRNFTEIQRLAPQYDFFIDNPYETIDDILKSYRCLIGLPTHQLRINIHNQALFPGTELYARALDDGIVSASQESVRGYYMNGLRHQKNYATFLIHAAWLAQVKGVRRYLPQVALRALSRKPFLGAFSLLPEEVWSKLSLATRRFAYHDYARPMHRR